MALPPCEAETWTTTTCTTVSYSKFTITLIASRGKTPRVASPSKLLYRQIATSAVVRSWRLICWPPPTDSFLLTSVSNFQTDSATVDLFVYSSCRFDPAQCGAVGEYNRMPILCFNVLLGGRFVTKYLLNACGVAPPWNEYVVNSHQVRLSRVWDGTSLRQLHML